MLGLFIASFTGIIHPRLWPIRIWRRLPWLKSVRRYWLRTASITQPYFTHSGFGRKLINRKYYATTHTHTRTHRDTRPNTNTHMNEWRINEPIDLLPTIGWMNIERITEIVYYFWGQKHTNFIYFLRLFIFMPKQWPNTEPAGRRGKAKGTMEKIASL